MNDSVISTIKKTIKVSLNEEEIILSLFKLKKYKKGEFFLREDEISGFYYERYCAVLHK